MRLHGDVSAVRAQFLYVTVKKNKGVRMINGHGTMEDEDDGGDGNGGQRCQWQCRRWTSMAMADSNSNGDGNVADGKQRRCRTVTATAMTWMGNDVDGGVLSG